MLHGRLVEVPTRTAEITSEQSLPPAVHHLAVWRFLATVEVKSKVSKSPAPSDLTWERVRQEAGPGGPHLYVPAFTLSRAVVQRLGTALVRKQPRLDLVPGLPRDTRSGPHLVAVSGSVHPLPETVSAGDAVERGAPGPGFEGLSPVLLTEEDAQAVAHFVYLALESEATPELRSIGYDLDLTGAQLVFLPAVYEPGRAIHSNWRLLLREFDGLGG
jgi:hypothetical protein